MYKFELVPNKTWAISKFQTKKNAKTENKIIVNNVINKVLVHQFVSLSKIPLIADSCFISFLTNLNKKNSTKITVLFELLWANASVSKIFSNLLSFIFKGLKIVKESFLNKLSTIIWKNKNKIHGEKPNPRVPDYYNRTCGIYDRFRFKNYTSKVWIVQTNSDKSNAIEFPNKTMNTRKVEN